MNLNLIKKLQIDQNNYIMNIIDDVTSENWNSFGLHIIPNILFKLYNSLNLFDFNIIFDYELSIKDNIKIYDGSKWIIFDKYTNIKGNFDEIINFNFTKNYWRISTKNIQTYIKINNLKIIVNENEIFNCFKQKKSLLIIGGELNISKDFDENDNKIINSFLNNYLFHLKKFLIKKYNFNVYNLPLSEMEGNVQYLDGLINFDYCIDITQMGLTKKGDLFYNCLKKKIKNKTFSIYDSGIKISQYFNILENYILCAIPDYNEPKVKYIGWAADEKNFIPKQNLNKKIILIDDCHYNINENNDSYAILNYCINLLLIHEDLQIIRFGLYDKVVNFNDKYKNNIDRYLVIENKIPITEKAEIHNKSWIFFCTHYETLGIPNIESAMAGSLLIHKKNYVNDFLTTNLIKITYNDINELNNIDIFSKVNFEKQRSLALNYTWEKLVDNIHNIF